MRFVQRASRGQPHHDPFDEHWRRRHVAPALGQGWPFEGDQPGDLETLVGGRARRLRESLGTHNRVAIGVAVERRDGMTWSAAASRRAIEAQIDNGWEVRGVVGKSDPPRDGLNELADLIGSSRAVREAARKSGLVPELRRYWAWWLTTAAIVLLVGAGETVLRGAASRPTSVGGSTFGLLLGMAAAALLYRLVIPQVAPVFGPSATRKVRETLNSNPVASDAEDAFKAALLERLVPGRRRRAIVIDDVGKLRPRTRDLVKGYIEQSSSPGEEELWVLFERGRRPRRAASYERAEPLNATFLWSLSPGPRLELWRGRQKPLTPKEKEQLLLRRDRQRPSRTDPRLRQRGVADIAARPHGDDEDATEIAAQVEGLEPSILRAFVLLAVAATVPDPAPIGPADLAQVARLSDSSPAARLLTAWFPADSQSPAAIAQSVKAISRDLLPLLEDPPERPRYQIKVASQYADAMLASPLWQHERTDLPPIELGHAFWALYWHDRLVTSWSAPVAERMVAHLRALREPAQFRRRHGAKVRDALVDAAVAGLEASLALSVGGLGTHFETAEEHGAPGLVEQARLLLDSGGAVDRGAVERLVAAAFVAYALTGDESLLESIALLSQDALEVRGEDPLLELYRAASVGPGGPPWPVMTDSNGDAALDHFRAFACLLAEILSPLCGAVDAPWLAAVSETASTEKSLIVDRALRRLRQRRGTISDALDCLTLTLLALSDVVSEWRRGSHQVLRERGDEIRSLTLELIEARGNPGTRTNFILDGALWQATVTSRGALVALKHDPGSAHHLLMELDQLNVMWQNLELFELAHMSVAIRNAAAIIGGRPRVRTFEDVADYLVGLSHQPRPLYRLAIELMVGIARLDRNVARANAPLVEAAHLALDQSPRSPLAFELGRAVTLEITGTKSAGRRELLIGRLLDSAPPGRDLFDLPEERSLALVRGLLGSVQYAGSPVASRVRGAIRGLIDATPSPWSADRLEQEIEWFDAFHARRDPDSLSIDIFALLARWRTRFWDGRPPGITPAEGAAPPTYSSAVQHIYPWVLGYLWDLSGGDFRVIKEAERLVRTQTPDEYDIGLVWLAGYVHDRLCGKDGDPELAERSLRIQYDNAERAAKYLSPDSNQDIYERLAFHYSQFAREAAYWRIEDERLEDERLAHYTTTGRYFEVVWHYYSRVPELPCDIDRATVTAELNGSNAYLVGQEILAEPLIYDREGLPLEVSGAFLRLGHHHFHTARRDDNYADARAVLDHRARAHLRGLYWLLIERTNVPDGLKDIFRRQSERFSNPD
jgi:hypothetical protein